jgi:hypothetical protein
VITHVQFHSRKVVFAATAVIKRSSAARLDLENSCAWKHMVNLLACNGILKETIAAKEFAPCFAVIKDMFALLELPRMQFCLTVFKFVVRDNVNTFVMSTQIILYFHDRANILHLTKFVVLCYVLRIHFQ